MLRWSPGLTCSSRMATKKPKTVVISLRKPAPPLPGPAKDDMAARVNGPPPGLDIDFESITRLVDEDSAANGDNNDPLVLEGVAELQLRKLTTRLGFDRLPLTMGELQGLLEYFNMLESATGEALTAPEHAQKRASWHQVSLATCEQYFPALVPAMRLYIAGNIDGLRALHQREDTLTKLGHEYNQFG